MTADDGPKRRSRRSREEVTEALVDAAAELLAERSSGHVTVRDVAARAGVNPALVHRYFGTKRELMRAAVARSQRRITATVGHMQDPVRGAETVLHATLQERALVASFARAMLDGTLDDLPPGNPAMAGLTQLFTGHLERCGSAGRRDPRVVAACVSSAALGYALFGELVRRGTGLDDEPHDRLEAEIVATLQDLVGTALSCQPDGPSAGPPAGTRNDPHDDPPPLPGRPGGRAAAHDGKIPAARRRDRDPEGGR